MNHFYPKIPTGAQISTQRPTLLLISQFLDALNYQTWLLIVAKTYSLYPVVQYAYDLILFYIYEFMNHWKL